MRVLLLLLALPSLAVGEPVPWCIEESPPRCCPDLPIAALAANEYVVDRDWLVETDQFALNTLCGTVLERVPSWAPRLRLKHGSFSLVGLTERSAYFHLGLRDGDVVKAVQGRPLSPTSLMSLYEERARVRLIVVDLERDGRDVRLWYHLVRGCHGQG